MTISPYYQNPYLPNFDIVKTDYDLVVRTLENKQNKYDQAFSNIQNLRQQALNINFLHPEGKKQIDEYNKELDGYFNSLKDYGDLSNPELQNKYVDMFTKIGSDRQLQNLYKVDKQYQSTIGKINGLKSAKDPYKAGYSPTNEYVWMQDLETYRNLSKDEAAGYNPAQYTPYYDIQPEIQESLKSLKFDGSTIEVPDPNNPGRMIRERVETLSPDKIKGYLRSSLSPLAQKQIEIDADYSYIVGTKYNPGTFKQNVYSSLINNSKANLAGLTEQLKDLEARVVNNTINGNTQDNASIAENISKIKDLIDNEQKTIQTSESSFYSKSPEELQQIHRSLYKEAKFQNLSNTFSTKVSERIYKPDAAFFQSKQLEMKIQNDAFDHAFKQRQLQQGDARLQLEEQKLALDIQKEQNDQLANAAKTNAVGTQTDANGNILVPSNDLGTEEKILTDYKSMDTKFNDLQSKAKVITDEDINLIVSNPRLSDGAEGRYSPQGFEADFARQYFMQNQAYLNGLPPETQKQVLKQAVQEFKEGKAQGYEKLYNSMTSNWSAQNALWNYKQEQFKQAKSFLGIDDAANPINGKFWSNGQSKWINAEEVAKRISDQIGKSENLIAMYDTKRVLADDNDYPKEGKFKAQQVRQDYLSMINSRIGKNEDGSRPYLTEEMLDFSSLRQDGFGNVKIRIKSNLKTSTGDDLNLPSIIWGDQTLALTPGQEINFKDESLSTTSDTDQITFILGGTITEVVNGYKVVYTPDAKNKVTYVDVLDAQGNRILKDGNGQIMKGAMPLNSTNISELKNLVKSKLIK